LLAANLPLFPCRIQLPISLSMDLLLTAGDHVQADIVVMFHVPLHQPPLF
jgi:hypothetical protein